MFAYRGRFLLISPTFAPVLMLKLGPPRDQTKDNPTTFLMLLVDAFFIIVSG